MFPKSRNGVSKIVVMIVDEMEGKNREWRASVLSIRKMGIRVVLIGVGSRVSLKSLRPLVDNDGDIVIVGSFAALMRNAVDLAKTTCDAAGQ